MKPHFRRMLQALAVMIWGGAILYFYGSGRINHYLATDFRPIAFAGGLGLMVLGLFNLLTATQEVGCGHDHSGEDEAAHDHEAGDMHPLTAFILMVLPLVLSIAWTKDKYSVSALTRKGLYETPKNLITPFLASSMPKLTLEEIENTHCRTEDGFLQFNLMELFFATGDRELQTLIDGLKIETEGRWMTERVRNPNGSRMRLYRLFMTCCAADSQAIPVILEFGTTPPDFPDNSWVKVSGTMRFPLEEGELHPLIMVEQAIAAEPPFEESFMRK